MVKASICASVIDDSDPVPSVVLSTVPSCKTYMLPSELKYMPAIHAHSHPCCPAILYAGIVHSGAYHSAPLCAPKHIRVLMRFMSLMLVAFVVMRSDISDNSGSTLLESNSFVTICPSLNSAITFPKESQI